MNIGGNSTRLPHLAYGVVPILALAPDQGNPSKMEEQNGRETSIQAQLHRLKKVRGGLFPALARRLRLSQRCRPVFPPSLQRLSQGNKISQLHGFSLPFEVWSGNSTPRLLYFALM